MTREDAKAFMQKAWRETMKGSYAEEAYEMAIKALEQPTIEPPRKTDEWCSDCKEYDQEKHCCPRFNRVIRQTLSEQTEIIRCKECKHMITHEGYGYLGEPAYTCEGNMEGWVLPDSFCSHAERKDGD